MILDSYESPTRGLSYAVPFVSIFEVFYEIYGEYGTPKFRSTLLSVSRPLDLEMVRHEFSPVLKGSRFA